MTNLKNLKQFRQLHAEAGQTLIETIVAIFVLTTALVAGVGLAIYAFSISEASQNEIIATNLAREGVEVMRMMRDSNWLASDAAGGAWDLTACADIASKLCYPSSFVGPTYNIANSGSAGNMRITFNPAANSWGLDTTANYNLYLQADGTYMSNLGTINSVFARMINVTLNATAPYTGPNPELIIKSVVVWRGKGCTTFATTQNLLTLSTKCRIVVEDHLTNWKDYK